MLPSRSLRLRVVIKTCYRKMCGWNSSRGLLFGPPKPTLSPHAWCYLRQWKPPEAALALATFHLSHFILLIGLSVHPHLQPPLLLAGDCHVATFEQVEQKCLFSAHSDFPVGMQLDRKQLPSSKHRRSAGESTRHLGKRAHKHVR